MQFPAFRDRLIENRWSGFALNRKLHAVHLKGFATTVAERDWVMMGNDAFNDAIVVGSELCCIVVKLIVGYKDQAQ